MFDRSSTFGEALDSPAARSVLEVFLPGIAASPMASQFRGARLGQVVNLVPGLAESVDKDRFFAALAELEEGGAGRAPYAPAIDPHPEYEPESVPRGSAGVTLPQPTPQWGVVEVRFAGPSHGNPFVDVELTASFTNGGRTLRVGGFYDGDGEYVLRLLAEEVGTWRFETSSTARSLDGITGEVVVTEPDPGAHGPVRADGFHFVHADGTRYRPVGTTAYAWTHQPEELQERTLRALEGSSFTKMRMCIFPKSYLYNENEPEDFPFPGSIEEGFDLERFDTGHFRRVEQRIAQLGALGIEADLILFHAYDRWGFADLGRAVDERALRYVVRRLAAYANVWWALANEYDLLWAKTEEDWERIAEIIGEEDPHGHLTSIHNCRPFYDQTRPWITHASVQRVDVYRTAENTDHWREQWNKPIVIDECGYEGDIDQGWGNLTGEELVRRCWEGAIRGGYVAHGETYLNDAHELWWSKGGELVGSSPARMAFLDGIIAESPTGTLEPLPSDWDVPFGGVAGEYVVLYFGFNRPRFRNVVLPDGTFEVDVIDTWGMTVEPVPGVHSGVVRVELPGRQYMAVRLRLVQP
ncbi:DUF5605 domain-containing protein [Microbacterium sp. DT81.1]|uniref:DUF5605 domain-containing protein n=1 Tax=Microbacterium sp. DT81.1 TaxID=3393413 RepID=UPI003CF359FF